MNGIRALAHATKPDSLQKDQAKLKGYLRKLKSVKFVVLLALYRDILHDLVELSLCFQSNQALVSEVRANSEAFLDKLQTKRNNLESMTCFAETKKELLDSVQEEHLTYRGHELDKNADFDLRTFDTVATSTINAVITQVKFRVKSFVDD